MTSYQSRNHIHEKLEQMIPEKIAECQECDELPQSLEELILHNFQAKYVCYHKAKNTIEVGVEEKESSTSYPSIKTHVFRLEAAVSALRKTFKSDDQDLKFYAKLLSSNESTKIDDVVLV